MLFNSYIFLLVFLPLVLAIWWSLGNRPKVRLTFLTVASYAFYGWWDWRFSFLLLLSTIIDYVAGGQIYRAERPKARLFWLLVSLVSNLGILFFFKYTGFLAQSINALSELVQGSSLVAVPKIILPVGISFYTFQTISYSIDIYRRTSRPANDFFHFSAYVSMFPQLIAGPIVRYCDIEEQLRKIKSRIDWSMVSQGIYFFVIGMGQKVLLADSIAAKINPLFGRFDELQFAGAWFCMLGYTMQLYFDFAGYSNMAIGLGLFLGFRFPINFNSPYKAVNISDFWRRWHISLSQWLRDYLFIPLGGSKFGNYMTLRNLMIVMFLGGLWHGAGSTFIVWGIYHGLLLVGHQLFKATSIPLPKLVSMALTFFFVLIGWVFFRSENMPMAFDLFGSLCGLSGLESDWSTAIGGLKSLGLLGVIMVIAFLLPNAHEIKKDPVIWKGILLALILAACVSKFGQESPFLYFQF